MAANPAPHPTQHPKSQSAPASKQEAERGAREGGREGPLPVAGAHLVAEHSRGGGGGTGEGSGGEGGKEDASRLPPGLLSCARVLRRRLATPGRRRTPPERAWERAHAHFGGRRAAAAAAAAPRTRFGGPLPSRGGGKEVPPRQTAHARSVIVGGARRGGFLPSVFFFLTRGSAHFPPSISPDHCSGARREGDVSDGAGPSRVLQKDGWISKAALSCKSPH